MGESARKPGAPTVPLTPEELLTALPGEGFTLEEKALPPFFFTLCLGGAPVLRNWMLKRPFFAGIYNHIILGTIGFALGSWYGERRRAERSEKDAIFLHYISLHPEDFPPFERKRIKDVFLPWTPKR